MTARRASQIKDAGAKEKPSAKYELILRAAIRVFARNGFFNSKVADIAREAGVADGTVYLYFKNKDDILVSIFDHVMAEALEKGRAGLAELTDPVDKLKRIIDAHLEWCARDRDLAIVFQVELRSSTKFMEQFSDTRVTEYLDMIGGVIAEGQAAGVFRRELNTRLVAKMLFGAMDEMVTNWILSRKGSSPVSTADAIVDLFLNGLAAAGGRTRNGK